MYRMNEARIEGPNKQNLLTVLGQSNWKPPLHPDSNPVISKKGNAEQSPRSWVGGFRYAIRDRLRTRLALT